MTKNTYEVWCQLMLSKKSEKEIFSFFRNEYSIPPEYIINNLHLTVYHCSRKLEGLHEQIRSCSHVIDTYETRFMVLAPGGENPNPNLIPAFKKVGVRVKKKAAFRKIIDEYRLEMINYETTIDLGRYKTSTKNRSAFGFRNFQPHISFLKSGSGIPQKLTEIGENFREFIPELKFDKYVIKIKINKH